MSKPNWVAEYNCVCGVTLKSVTPASIDSHLKGRRHAEAIAAPAPDFQDYTCDCGRKMYHVKQTQIDQHRAGRECREKLASLRGAAVLDSVVESVPRDHAFQEEEPGSPLDQHPAARDSRLEPSPDDEDMD